MIESIRMKLPHGLQQFLTFGILQARACIFAGSFFVLLFLSNHIPLGPIPRYDFLFVSAVLLQIILIATKIESKDEAKTIFLFHLIGLFLEWYKTQPSIAAWSYPEFSYLRLGTVPLYSGFMYAAVGSYISQSWRLMKLSVTNYPPYKYSIPLSVAIYVNFFTRHFIPDIRIFLGLLVVIVFWKTIVHYQVNEKRYRMPLVVAFLLIGFFIWIAENISTYWGAWEYPNQIDRWSLVYFHKISSWALLVIISVIIVFDLKLFKEKHQSPITALPPDDSSTTP